MNDKEKIALKIKFKEIASEILQKRIDTSFTAMKEAQMSANEEGKSSVGDKYETSRAMAQIDRDIHARQLENAKRDLNFIHQVDVTMFYNQVEIGAFVDSGNGKYFFLTGLGLVEIGIEKIIFLSINSPIGRNFLGKKKGDKVNFNGMEILIKELF